MEIAWIVPNSGCGIPRAVRITFFLSSKFELTGRQTQHILPKRRNRLIMLHDVRSQMPIPCRSTHYESLKRHRTFLDRLPNYQLIQAKLYCGCSVHCAKTFVLEVRDVLDFPTAVDFLSVEYMINERFHRWLMRVYATYDCDVTIFDDLPIALPLYSAHICCCCCRRMINWADW